jgi:hypothetical protein
MSNKTKLNNALEQGGVVSDEANPSANGLNLDGLQTDVYKFAGLVGEQKGLARSILEKVPNWLDGNIDKSVVERIDRALLLRHKEIAYGEYGYIELNGAKQFLCFHKVSNGAVITDEPKLKDKCANVMRIDADYCLSYTGQQFGALKKEDADKHKVFSEWRTTGSKYISNVKGKITTQIKELVKPDNITRNSVADFTDWLTDSFKDAKKRCKTSKDSRGDTTANPDKFDGAVKAFWDKYNAK